MRLDKPHEQATTRLPIHLKLEQLYRFSEKTGLFADLVEQGVDLPPVLVFQKLQNCQIALSEPGAIRTIR